MTQHRRRPSRHRASRGCTSWPSASTATPPPSATATVRSTAPEPRACSSTTGGWSAGCDVQLGRRPLRRTSPRPAAATSRSSGPPPGTWAPRAPTRRSRCTAAARWRWRGLTEQIRVISRGAEPVTAQLVVRLAGDGADISAVKSGLASTTAAGRPRPRRTGCPGGTSATPRPSRRTPRRSAVTAGRDGAPSVLVFPVSASPGADAVVTLRVRSARTARDEPATPTRGRRAVAWTAVAGRGGRPAPRPRRHVELRRPAAPAPDRPPGPVRRLRRRRNPLVPHAVRP